MAPVRKEQEEQEVFFDMIVGPSLAPPVRSCSPPTPPIMSKKASRSSSKKAKKSGSNVFDMFTQAQVAEFKDGFQIMDRARDGVISKDDLRGAFSEIGRMVSEDHLESMLADAPGPLNFTTFLQMFAARSSGESDDDEVVRKAIKAFEKFPDGEVGDAFALMDIDEDTLMIDADALIGML